MANYESLEEREKRWDREHMALLEERDALKQRAEAAELLIVKMRGMAALSKLLVMYLKATTPHIQSRAEFIALRDALQALEDA